MDASNPNNILAQISQLPGQYFTRELNHLNNQGWSTPTPQHSGNGLPFVVGLIVEDPPSAYKKVSYKTDNSTTETGKRALEAVTAQNNQQNAFNGELQKQVNAMKAIPPLALIINPSSFTKRMERPADYARGRRLNIVSMWHESMTQISAEGVSAGQYIYKPNAAGGGINGVGRVLSVSYSNLLSLVQIYRSNGIVYNNADFEGHDSLGVPIAVGSVYIQYDGFTYIGSFDSFTITDDASKPNSIAYSFEFTARYVVKDET